jgi:hypothetical protein
MSVSDTVCSQCGQPVPADPVELARWKGGELLLAGELEDFAVGLLICPDCVRAERAGNYEAGEGD